MTFPTANDRIAAPDIARGFMLLGIALANVTAYLWARPLATGTLHLAGGSVLDRTLSAFVMLLIDQRIYPMFAFLFGYGIVQFTWSRLRRGVPESVVQRMLMRRHLWLIVFGGMHALLLFSGDILGAYGLTGLMLAAIFWRASDRAITITASVLAGLAVLGAVLLAAGGVLLAAVLPTEVLVSEMGDPLASDLMNGLPNYFYAALIRFGVWVMATPMTVLALLVPAAMMLGMLAARHRWLEGAMSRLRLETVATWGIVIGIVGALPATGAYLGLLPGLTGIEWTLMGIGQVTGLCGGLGYAALFGIAARNVGGDLLGWRWAVAAMGKRSLSCYLLQSVIYAPLLSGWGFGLGATISASGAYALAIGVWLISAILAVWLEQRGKRGPAEKLLRRLTYGPIRSQRGAELNAQG